MSSRDNAFDSKKRTYTTEKWFTILKLSTKFQCSNLRKEALLSLESGWSNKSLEHPTAIELLKMGRSFWVQKWVICGYMASVGRGKGISEEEMLEIGSVEAFRLMRMREKRKACFDSEFDIQTAVQQVFQEEIAWIVAEEKKCEGFHYSTEDGW